jgi:hypothetical protein
MSNETTNGDGQEEEVKLCPDCGEPMHKVEGRGTRGTIDPDHEEWLHDSVRSLVAHVLSGEYDDSHDEEEGTLDDHRADIAGSLITHMVIEDSYPEEDALLQALGTIHLILEMLESGAIGKTIDFLNYEMDGERMPPNVAAALLIKDFTQQFFLRETADISDLMKSAVMAHRCGDPSSKEESDDDSNDACVPLVNLSN